MNLRSSTVYNSAHSRLSSISIIEDGPSNTDQITNERVKNSSGSNQKTSEMVKSQEKKHSSKSSKKSRSSKTSLALLSEYLSSIKSVSSSSTEARRSQLQSLINNIVEMEVSEMSQP